MVNYPLVFEYKDIIAGNGFFAGIYVRGQALLTEEADGFWMAGVTPGGIAGGGQERAAAFRAFKESYLSVLFDIAAEAPSFAAFEREVEAFFGATCAPAKAEWIEAREHIRRGVQNLDLPKVKVTRPRIKIEQIKKATPQTNAFDHIGEAEAA